MPRNTKSEIWNYFEYVNADSANCKKCGRCYSRKGRTTTSLKNHLRSAHPQEFLEFLSLDTARSQQNQAFDDFKLKEAKQKRDFHSINESSLNDANTTLESNELYSTDSRPLLSPTIDIKEEILQPPNILEIIALEVNNKNNQSYVDVNQNAGYSFKIKTLETHEAASDNSGDEGPAPAPAHNDGYEEPIAKKIILGYDPLNDSTLSTKQRQQNRSVFRNAIPDPLNESYAKIKEDNLERALRKRKLLLEIEQLQIQNYDMKLKLWEKEQQLQMTCSRFTKDFAERRREDSDHY